MTETTSATKPADLGGEQPRPALSAIDFVQMYLAQTELRPGEGHAVESHACKRARPSGLPKDSNYRCARCDGLSLLAQHERQQESSRA